MRDCTVPRKPDYNPNLCKNCNEEGHRASECEKPRVASETTECRKCSGMGHFSKDCPTAGPNICFNCGYVYHSSSSLLKLD